MIYIHIYIDNLSDIISIVEENNVHDLKKQWREREEKKIY